MIYPVSQYYIIYSKNVVFIILHLRELNLYIILMVSGLLKDS